MKIGLIILVIILVLGFWVGSTYIGHRNAMVTKREAVNSAWSQVDVVLQRRADLIPNLVETVKGFALHEEKVFGNIAEDLLFVESETFDRLHQVRDEVSATLQYHVHLRPCRVHRFPLGHHRIAMADVCAANPEPQHKNDDKDDQSNFHVRLTFNLISPIYTGLRSEERRVGKE